LLLKKTSDSSVSSRIASDVREICVIGTVMVRVPKVGRVAESVRHRMGSTMRREPGGACCRKCTASDGLDDATRARCLFAGRLDEAPSLAQSYASGESAGFPPDARRGWITGRVVLEFDANSVMSPFCPRTWLWH
jgi:hypothetical protein